MSTRICVIDRRQHERESQTCLPCEIRMAGQLTLLADAIPLLAVVASTEPTSSGNLNLNAIDLTLPGNPAHTGKPEDQTGHTPVAAALARWAENWSHRDIITADTTSVAGFLRRGLAWACREHPHIAEFATDLRRHYAVVRVALGRNMEPVRYNTPCPHCGHKTIVRTPGADWIECKPCKALWDEDDYHHVARQALRRSIHPHELLTTSEAAVLAGVTPDVIRQWARRGKLAQLPGPVLWDEVLYYRIEVDYAQASIENNTRNRAAATARRAAREQAGQESEMVAA